MNNDNSSLPLISVVLPTYNRCDLLAEALRSVVGQSYSNWELLVIDDGSTEPVEATVKSFSDQRITYHRQMNQGASVARNLGIQIAKGEYVTFLDSDDMMEPTCLAEKVGLAQLRPDAGVIGGGCRYMDFDGNLLSSYTRPRKSINYDDLAVWTAFPGATGNIFSKREILLRVGGFKANLFDSEDRDLLRRLVELEPIISVDVSTLIMRVHTTLRINRDLASLMYSRRWVTKQVKTSRLRRVSSAWDEHVFGVKCWQAGAWFSAIYHWVYSFLIHPAPLRPELERMREIARLFVQK